MKTKNQILIEQLFQILTELDARENSNNFVVQELIDASWVELCDKAIKRLEHLKR